MFTLYMLWVSPNSHTFWVYQNSVLMECHKYDMQIEGWGTVDMHIAFISSAHTHISLSHQISQKISSKMKFLRVPRWWEQSIKASTRPFWAVEPRATAQVTLHGSWLALPTCFVKILMTKCMINLTKKKKKRNSN